MNFAAVVRHRSGRVTPSLRDAAQRQPTSTTGRRSIYRKRNAVQTKPATSDTAMDIKAICRIASTAMILAWAALGIQPAIDEARRRGLEPHIA
jgi:hypothetical protein